MAQLLKRRFKNVMNYYYTRETFCFCTYFAMSKCFVSTSFILFLFSGLSVFSLCSAATVHVLHFVKFVSLNRK